MTVLESEDYNGLADGATITTANTSFDVVNGSSLVATTNGIHGAAAVDLTTGTGSDDMRWTANVNGRTTLYSRVYYEMVAAPPGNDSWFMGCINAAESVVCVVALRSNGQLRILQSNDTGGAQNSTLTVSTNDTFRIEHFVDLDNDTQSAEIYLNANVEGETPDETITATATMADMASWSLGRILSRDVPFIGDAVAIGDAAIGPIQTGHNVNVGQASSTEQALSITPSKAKELGQAAETNQALAIVTSVSLPDERTVTVAREPRVLTVSAESRAITVARSLRRLEIT